MQIKALSFQEKEKIRQEATARKRYTGLIQSSWEGCFLHMLSTSIPINLYFQVNSWYECPMFGTFFQVWHVDLRVYSLEFGGTKNWLTAPDRGLSNEVEESLSEDVFSNHELSGLRSSSPGTMLWKICPTNAWLFSIDFVRLLQHLSIFPFISCGSKEVGTKYIRHLVIILKRKCLWPQKR